MDDGCVDWFVHCISLLDSLNKQWGQDRVLDLMDTAHKVGMAADPSVVIEVV